LNWVAVAETEGAFDADVKVRAAHPAEPARVEPAGADTMRVVFAQPQHAITPGQAAVFYRGDVVLGGGTIESVG
jgi:tRNA-specific 2-thiouridylase